MKVLTTAGLTKLIQLCKSAFVDKTDVVETQTVTLATVATSGSYNDLSNKPNIPTVNNATLTIQKNGTTVKTFTANASSNVTANITVPTNNNQLTNGAGYITSSALTGYATETWVGQQGYITGITSAMVTTALGYTPYDASNPNGYTSNTGTVTSVNNVSPVNGNVSLSIPTVNNPTITLTQGGVTKGSFTLNQSAGDTIALDAGGSSNPPTPDYSNGVDMVSSPYTVSAYGVIYIQSHKQAATWSGDIEINGVTVYHAETGNSNTQSWGSPFIPVAPGDVVSWTYNRGTDVQKFYPYRT